MTSENIKEVTLQVLKDLRSDMRELRSEVGELRAEVGELRSDFGKLRDEMGTGFKALIQKDDRRFLDHEGRLRLVETAVRRKRSH